MDKQAIEQFFKVCGERLNLPVKVYLTGGIAAWFMGGSRPTQDIDCAVEPVTEQVQSVFMEVSREQGIPIQYSDDIERWGMINIPDLTQGARLYKRFSPISVYVLAPEKWAIGKLTRYLESDVQDLVAVFCKTKPPLGPTLAYWQRALKESPQSSEQILFKNQVNQFLKTYGQKIWGKSSSFPLL